MNPTAAPSRFKRYLVILSALALGAACLACSGAGQAGIVFVSDRDGNMEIYSISPSGGEETNLTNSADDEFEPRVSPDKRRVAFRVQYDDGSDLDVIDLGMEDEAERRTRISSGPWLHKTARWSPDSRRLAYVNAASDVSAVYVSSVEDPAPQPVSTIPGDEIGSWSPNGDTVVFAVREGENRGIWIRNPDGVNEDRLTDTPDYSPIWSPDSQKIAFLSTRDGNPEIYVMNSDGTEQERLTETEADEYDISWSPNGRKILFVSERDGNPEIYALTLGQEAPLRLTRNTLRDLQPVWSPNGQQIAFVSYLDGDGEIFVMNQDGSNQTRLTNNDAEDTSPSW
jgi:Tol biopolymer transport system component